MTATLWITVFEPGVQSVRCEGPMEAFTPKMLRRPLGLSEGARLRGGRWCGGVLHLMQSTGPAPTLSGQQGSRFCDVSSMDLGCPTPTNTHGTTSFTATWAPQVSSSTVGVSEGHPKARWLRMTSWEE